MHTQRGFALSELLIIVVILGILSSIVIVNTNRELNRDRVNAVATGFTAWLQAIQGASSPLRRTPISAKALPWPA
jgi:prepilin-type N-terminal cleavage/methylation domain-containing protein